MEPTTLHHHGSAAISFELFAGSPARRVIMVAVTSSADSGLDGDLCDSNDADLVWGKPFPSSEEMLKALLTLPEFRRRYELMMQSCKW